MPNQAEMALTPDVTRYLRSVLRPLADDLLRRIQATATVLCDVDRSGMPEAAADRLEHFVVAWIRAVLVLKGPVEQRGGCDGGALVAGFAEAAGPCG